MKKCPKAYLKIAPKCIEKFTKYEINLKDIAKDF